MKSFRRGFTLIELLVVIAIVAVLAVTVILTLNPAELLKLARDTTRLSDLATLNTALATYQADVTTPNMGVSSTVYVSLPDASSSCATWSLPALPAGKSYACKPAASYRAIDGNGWVPVNFTSISSGSPLSNLPVDPVNTGTENFFYVYSTDGTAWQITALPEAEKTKAGTAYMPSYPGVISVGSSLNISPLFDTTDLIAYWNFDEGSGTTVRDSSGNGNTGTWSGTSTYWTAGKVGSSAGLLNGSHYIQLADGTGFDLTGANNKLTFAAWIRWPAATRSLFSVAATNYSNASHMDLNFGGTSAILHNGSGNRTVTATVATGDIVHIVGVANRTTNTFSFYVNGALQGSAVGGLTYLTPTAARIGQGSLGANYADMLDDVRIYDRDLSAAEIKALYLSTR